MFPDDVIQVLSTLHTDCPAHSFEETREIIEQEFLQPIETLFERFDRVPIASGAIAQVYKAKMKGVDVCVKVRHPWVDSCIDRDLRIIKAFARQVQDNLL